MWASRDASRLGRPSKNQKTRLAGKLPIRISDFPMGAEQLHIPRADEKGA